LASTDLRLSLAQRSQYQRPPRRWSASNIHVSGGPTPVVPHRAQLTVRSLFCAGAEEDCGDVDIAAEYSRVHPGYWLGMRKEPRRAPTLHSQNQARRGMSEDVTR
jgi:hypothetical protein